MRKFTPTDFLQPFWALVRLRYRLIWAHARTGSGRIALLFALYLLGGVFALFFSFGGFGVAIGMVESGHGESIARWTLAGLFANGIGLSLLFGLGPREAFSEQSLRRYPLNSRERFAVRHVIGLLDPTWLILIAGAFGVAIGFVWLGAGSMMTGLPAVVLLIVTNYLATAALLSVIGMMMQTRTGAALLGSAVILLVSIGPLAFASLVSTRRVEVWQVFETILQVTPPGAAAAMIAGQDPVRIFGGAGLLLLWCAILIYMLSRLESQPQTSPDSVAGVINWNDFNSQLGDLFGNKYGPLVVKSLRYHMRCNLIRFSLITSPIIVLLGKFLVPGNWPGGFLLISLATFFVMSSATGASLMLNLFGYDDAGIRRYAVLPISFADALRAGSFASLLLRAMTIFAAFALWLTFYRAESIVWQMMVMVLGIALASLFLFNALGLWTSVFAAKRLHFDAMWNNRLSLGANIVIIGGTLFPFWGVMILADRISQSVILSFWWVSLLILAICFGFYVFMIQIIERTLNLRRERLINLIAGASDK
jgi:hypothetical protein